MALLKSNLYNIVKKHRMERTLDLQDIKEYK